MCRKVMISQPMNGRSRDEILEVKNKAKAYLEDKGFEVVNTFFEEEFEMSNVKNKRVFYLGKSIEKMAECDAIYLCPDWQKADGCIAEKIIAELYGLKIILGY